MANVTNKRILEDGWRNAVVLLTGILDTSNASLTSTVVKGDFTNNGTAEGVLKAFRIDKISYSIADQLQVQLYWNATTPQVMAALAGRGHMKFRCVSGLQPANVAAAGFDGSLNLITTGWASGAQNYSILLEMVKVYG